MNEEKDRMCNSNCVDWFVSCKSEKIVNIANRPCSACGDDYDIEIECEDPRLCNRCWHEINILCPECKIGGLTINFVIDETNIAMVGCDNNPNCGYYRTDNEVEYGEDEIDEAMERLIKYNLKEEREN